MTHTHTIHAEITPLPGITSDQRDYAIRTMVHELGGNVDIQWNGNATHADVVVTCGQFDTVQQMMDLLSLLGPTAAVATDPVKEIQKRAA